MALLSLLLLAAGCFSLKREPPRKHMYVLDPGSPAGLSSGAEKMVVRVRPARIAPPYDSKSFVYRLADGTWESDYYNEFFAPPAELLTGQVRRWLAAVPGSWHIIEMGDRESATHTLDIRIHELFADYAQKGTRHAVIDLEFTVRASGPKSSEFFERRYRREVPFEASGPAALVAAWDGALNGILIDLVNDLNASAFPTPEAQRGP
jgi:uncharacterized lipoprotein YmbA